MRRFNNAVPAMPLLGIPTPWQIVVWPVTLISLPNYKTQPVYTALSVLVKRTSIAAPVIQNITAQPPRSLEFHRVGIRMTSLAFRLNHTACEWTVLPLNVKTVI